VVTAAESSLNQLLNLFSAYAFRRFFGLGRDESAKVKDFIYENITNYRLLRVLEINYFLLCSL